MKKIILPIAALTILAACSNNSANQAETSDKQAVAATSGNAYTIDSTTTITWKGSKAVGAPHTGTFAIKEGSLSVSDSTLTGGSFVIDITSLNNIDLASDTTMKAKLEGHLKSPDFFDVAKYPTAKFEITSVAPNSDTTKKATHIINGNLTLKDSTKNISFPATVTVTDTKVTAQADFSIDRTLWGINYKGPNNPQDWVISKEVGLKLDLSASKK